MLLILAILPILVLMRPGLPVTHDGQDHVARIANFYLSLTQGNSIPRWAGNLNWGYGHPILMFLYPMPSYIASFVHWIGFSFVDSTKLVFGIAFIASILAMYGWLNRAYGKRAGFIGALLYGFAPYRFIDMSVRGALGEHVAFVFPPLICWGLLLVAKKERKTLSLLLISLSSACLLLSHNALSLMFFPLIFLYMLYLFFFETKSRSRFLCLTSYVIFLGFLISAFFWVPAFFEGKYTLRDILTKGDFTNRFVSWQWFFVSPWNYGGGNEFSKEIGWFHWLGIVGSAIVFVKTKEKKLRIFISAFFIAFAASLFLMTEYSQLIWTKVTILQKFQFPWRFLSVSVFASAVLGGVTVSKFQRGKLLLTVFCLLLIVQSYFMWFPKDFSIKPESFYSGIFNGTTDTGESSPIWSIRFMEQLPKTPYEIIEGKGNISSISRSSTKHEFLVNAQTKVRVLDNTLYFPGWGIVVDGQTVDVQFQDPQYRGLMTFWVEPGSHTVRVVFSETKLRQVADWISLGSLLVLIVTVIIGLTKIWQTKSR